MTQGKSKCPYGGTVTSRNPPVGAHTRAAHTGKHHCAAAAHLARYFSAAGNFHLSIHFCSDERTNERTDDRARERGRERGWQAWPVASEAALIQSSSGPNSNGVLWECLRNTSLIPLCRKTQERLHACTEGRANVCGRLLAG